jgi:hypothetical protein
VCLDDLDAVCLGKLREHVAHVGIRFESGTDVRAIPV